jgi:hypothetical protein
LSPGLTERDQVRDLRLCAYPEGLVPLTVGFISLAGILLLRLTNGNRQKMREILREIAAQTV